MTLVGDTFTEAVLRSPPWFQTRRSAASAATAAGRCWHSLVLLTKEGVECKRCEFAQLRMDELAMSLKDFSHIIQLATMDRAQNDVPLPGLRINSYCLHLS